MFSHPSPRYKRRDLTFFEQAQVEAARVRGWLSQGDAKRAEAALDRAMVALTQAEAECSREERPLLERLHAELEEVSL